MKLDAKHIQPYLLYKLKAEILDYKIDYVGRQYDIIVGMCQWSKCGKLWSLETYGGAKHSSDRIKPILRPLSDLTKEIEVNGERFVPIRELFNIAYTSIYDYKFEGEYEQDKYFDIHLALKAKEDNWDYGFTIELPYQFRMSANGSFLNIPQFELYQKLFEWHFDVFGLIDAGLAIDINSLNNR